MQFLVYRLVRHATTGCSLMHYLVGAGLSSPARVAAVVTVARKTSSVISTVAAVWSLVAGSPVDIVVGRSIAGGGKYSGVQAETKELEPRYPAV